MKKVLFAGAVILGLGVAGNALAIPLGENWAADFRSSAWNLADGEDSFISAEITAEALPNTGIINYKLSQDSTDGLGVQWRFDGDPDEIENPEKLSITSAGFEANGVWITDLFGPTDGVDPINGEVGNVLINGSLGFTFFGKDADQVNGEKWVDFGQTLTITSALFQAVGYPDTNWFGCAFTNYKDNEFSVAGFTSAPAPAPVPEPSTMVIAGTCLAGLAGSRLRRKKKE